MRIDKFIKENKGRSYDLPFLIPEQDNELLSSLFRIMNNRNYFSRREANKNTENKVLTININNKEILP